MEKYLQDGVHVLMAGFVDGNLVYVLKVSLACLYDAIKTQLGKQFHGDHPTGVFLRSANFSFRDYAGCLKVRLIFLHHNWQQFANRLTRDFRRYLEQLTGEVS